MPTNVRCSVFSGSALESLRLLASRIATLLMAALIAAPIWADDTEIFFANTQDGEISPNILFIVDTSGSMSNEVSGTGKTRMQNVQDALSDLINNLFDVNVGLMRFSNPGGPVAYQIDYIDRDVNENEDGLADVIAVIAEPEDDAQEVPSLSSVITDDARLEMNTLTVGSAAVESRRIISSADDGEEERWTNRCTETQSGTLEITHNDGSDQLQLVGLRFLDFNIPAGAVITNAYITFTVSGVDTQGLAEIRITGERDDTGEFDEGGDTCTDAEKDNISGRERTAAQVDWNLDDNIAAEQTVSTPALTGIVQEIVNHANWETAEDDMVFIFERRPGSTATGRYDFYARDGSNSRAPLLTVEYYVGAPPADYSAITGLRFQDVDVPRGVTITSATLSFTTAQADAAEATTLAIHGEASASSAAFSAAAPISSRSKTTAGVSWTPDSWDTVDEVQVSPDISSIVQEIVNRNDWCGGNDMGFVLEGSGLRMAYARDAGNGRQPVLNIQYDEDSIVPGASCVQETLIKSITAGIDDVEEAGGSVLTTGTQLDVQSGNSIGFRFTGINLPENANISEAYLEFVSDDTDTGTSYVDIRAQQSGDAEPFTNTDGTVDDRSWSTAVNWTITDTWNTNDVVRSPDIRGLVQGIVDRGDWTMGNDMAFLVDFTSGSDRDIESYDGNSLQAAKLVVYFEDDGTEAEVRLVRDELLEVVNSLNTQGYTPIQDTLYEAARYYRGEGVDYGAYRGGPNDGGPHAYTRVSVANSMKDGTYVINRPAGCTVDNLGAAACAGETISGIGGDPIYATPIKEYCQKSNHIILLTDGQANRPHSEAKIRAMTGDSSCMTSFTDAGGTLRTVQSGEECVLDLVSFLKNEDQSDLKETQSVTTHTIGFNFSSPWLEAVANYGGGSYREATNAADLVSEVQDILEQVLEVDSTFVAPVAAINQFNRLNHRQDIYFAVFRPTDSPTWPGNLKKYRLRESNNEIIDFEGDGKQAVNPDTGFFKDDAQSGWGGVRDGIVVEKSGAFSQLPLFDERKVFVSWDGMATNTLSDLSNRLAPSNTNLTKSMFGVDAISDAEFAEHLLWIQGKDVDDTYPASLPDGTPNAITGENRYILGDPLHSKPVAVTFGGTEAEPDTTVFYGSNAGFLHAVDADSGREVFAFLPKEMFEMQAELRENSNSVDHLYGIDGSVTPWVHDANGNGLIEAGDFVRLFFGMRRGGRNYYALDVTDRNNPRLMWQITGGQGDFAELGQTWSQPVPGTINIDGSQVDVLYFAGGYDPDQDDTDARANDDMGRAIYIVNAETGALIWSGGPEATFTENYPKMKYSIPANLAVVDITASGEDNMIFVGDLGGQVWRFDINNGAAVDDLIDGGVIADLGVASGDNSPANNRRFYHAPDVALTEFAGKSSLAVTIGSGFRAHPLSVETDDRFYMLRQSAVFSTPDSYETVAESDLYDATDNDVGEGVDGASDALANAKGWFFDLPNTGEKVLSTPLTFADRVTFTTYEPSPNSLSNNCIPAAGTSRVYQVMLGDASPANNWDTVTGLTEDDRSLLLKTSSIVDEPVVICAKGGCDLFVGTERPAISSPNTDRIVKTFWRKDQ